MKEVKADKSKRLKTSLALNNQTELTISNPTREQIAQRAYELYLTRGCADGYADEDWLQAERELQASGSKKF
ncbi:MAG: DUF2934 domain-containing protein [Nitrospira sp.]